MTSVTATEVVVGVLAPMGQHKAINMWQPTINHLQKQIPDYTFKLYPATKSQLSESVAQNKVDFFLTNSGHYVELEAMYGATRILTLKRSWKDQSYSQWGSVIFTLSSNKEIYSLNDIDSERFAAVYKGAFAGFQVAFRELLDLGVMSYDDIDKIIYTGFPHNSPLRAVFDGDADAGTIPTGVLEEVILSGKFKPDTFRVINPKNIEGFPFQLSTRLYHCGH